MNGRKQDFDFLNATGQAYFEWTSSRIAALKILDEYSFNFYRESAVKNHGYLFTDPSNDKALESAIFGSNINGEFFSNIKIGKNLQVGNNVNFVAHGGIRMGNDVRIGDDVQLITVFHSIHPENRIPLRASPLIIEDGAVIESGALLISSRSNGQPLVIGKSARVLAGSVVVANVKDGEVVGGRPARSLTKKDELVASFASSAEPSGLSAINSRQELINILGRDAAIFLPFYIEGAEHFKMGDVIPFINRSSRFSLKGTFSVSQAMFGPCVSVSVAEGASVALEPKVWVGAGATIQASEDQEIVIGEGSIIAAGALVTKSVPPMSIIIGNNQVKKTITDNDYDSSIPLWWNDLASCIAVADKVRAELEADIFASISGPTEMVEAIRMAKRDLEDSSRLYQEELFRKNDQQNGMHFL